MPDLSKIIVLNALFVLSLTQASAASPSTLVSIRGEAQGTTYLIKYEDQENRNFKREIDSLLADFDRSLSIYRSDSEIIEFNKKQSLTFRSPYFLPVLKKSLEVYKATNGAFDPTVMPLVEAYGFGAKKVKDPGSANIDSLLQLVGFSHIEFDSMHLVSYKPGLRLDFNGIAQGYSVDLVGDFLNGKGILNFMVEIGGEVLCMGTKTGNTSWTAGIENPVHPGTLLATVKVDNQAMTTAGNYRNHFTRNGQIFNHIINPKTGSMEHSNLLSVTVFAADAITADGYDTAFFVMGTEATKTFLSKRKDLNAYLVYTNERGGIETFATEGIRHFIKEKISQ